MDKPVYLDKRLGKIASLVPEGARIADIGTDHALLPIYLIKNGKCSFAVAADIGEGPLAKAQANVCYHHMEDRIVLKLTDGLQGIESYSVDTVIIAGMGGETIADILAKSCWIRNNATQLLLQPMTSEYELRQYLCRNGFSIQSEHTAVIPPHHYVIIKAQYDGVKQEASPLFYAVGSLTRCTDEDSAAYLRHKRMIYQRMLDGLMRSHSQQSRAAQIADLIEGIDQRLK